MCVYFVGGMSMFWDRTFGWVVALRGGIVCLYYCRVVMSCCVGTRLASSHACLPHHPSLPSLSASCSLAGSMAPLSLGGSLPVYNFFYWWMTLSPIPVCIQCGDSLFSLWC